MHPAAHRVLDGWAAPRHAGQIRELKRRSASEHAAIPPSVRHPPRALRAKVPSHTARNGYSDASKTARVTNATRVYDRADAALYASVMDVFSLKGRRALVTGASRGIGAATAVALDAAGARVALSGRDEGALRLVADGLAHEPVVLVSDLAPPSAPAALARAALEGLGGIEILVNNAAIAIRQPSEDLNAEQIDELFAVNVRAPLLLISALLPAMRKAGGASIVNLTTLSALRGTPRRAAYAASKGALEAATRSLAIELGPDGIRVNAVAPGVVDTALWAKNRAIPGVIETIEAQTPLRRWASVEDIADVIVFLASDAARFVTGQTISPDGGMAATLDLYGGAV
jgi:NAD(P)-dependent dehydrogenase (short-subunit alcohol dehydrogenase family)